MAIKLIALDIDDTLLNSHGFMLQSTRDSLSQALAAGIKVVLCSGRPLAGVRPFLNELAIRPDQQYAITYNGSIIESGNGHVIAELGLTNEIYRQVDIYAHNYRLQYNVLDRNSVIYTSNQDVNRMTVVQAWENQAGLLIRKPDDLPAKFSIVKAVFVGETTVLDQHEAGIRMEFGANTYVVRTAANFLEIMNQQANKGRALAKLAESLSLNPAEILVFGDERNDLPMFDYAGQAVAMGNATAAVKQHATYVTASNDEDGIAKALTKLVFN
ncbi:Cof-type HAD-IIB family hydrolase [Liquorilactobacillus satsumensis]|uniref:Cof-type HAD-IIB family hydrolase n=1 Tax=Liquorilactobacillus satsumensis TaxID=259059 RepID=UPI001E59ABD8|nr:Cof-type HAD-IIB family hydrolase [Liquorilactobacillus satsumensis]MCC7666280.1 hydrolase [Liquorilactobacillus satsumensis]MCP9358043.1 HAD family phosphatase [Liquorilactobacillus satsumensis]MCP9372054.1 HAD family phosphatase [Liquorilactobacillus satsumensis]